MYDRQERPLDNEEVGLKNKVRKDIIRAYDIPPETIGLSRWAGGFWWRMLRGIRHRLKTM